MDGQCEMCVTPTPATVIVHRVWHDGTLDPNLKACAHHSMSDHLEPAMWRMFDDLDVAKRYAQSLEILHADA